MMLCNFSPSLSLYINGRGSPGAERKADGRERTANVFDKCPLNEMKKEQREGEREREKEREQR
jgi:hypothetical protein